MVELEYGYNLKDNKDTIKVWDKGNQIRVYVPDKQGMVKIDEFTISN